MSALHELITTPRELVSYVYRLMRQYRKIGGVRTHSRAGNVIAKHYNDILGSRTARYEFFYYLLGVSSTSEMDDVQKRVLMDLIGLEVDSFDEMPDQRMAEMVVQAHAYLQQEYGGQQSFLEE
jgi:hypothetical protein